MPQTVEVPREWLEKIINRAKSLETYRDTEDVYHCIDKLLDAIDSLDSLLKEE